ncbi:MAG TPA: asparagine synthase (glutamine-hydrolyzing) [Phnomibacter sp.]|nr:asparagine synthase (glutamine-hydrolyzing) [Phnomibacter sp.]
MCGIAGSINFQFESSRINAAMGHRGPDAQTGYTHQNVQLHHLRLSILDAEGGKQPMHYMDRYTIIFNGEIYNHLDVRKELGLQCTTHSDTETLLHAYHVEGTAMLNRLDGMFAFVIYDKQEQSLFLARDRAGKKPLYFYNDGSRFVFASELNALRTILPLEVNMEHLPFYLRLGSMLQEHTPYRHVSELLQGSWVKVQVHNLECSKHRWWQIGDYYTRPQQKITEEDAIEKLDGLLNLAVKRRLESSDLEVGSFLSGGIDSGLVTAMAANLHPRLQTFTVSFDGSFDEAPLARLVAERYQTQHHEISIQLNHLQDDVEKIVAQYGEPFYDSSAIPSWYVSQAASQHLTVILNGDGADELFGGYRRYVPFNQYNFFKTPDAVRGLANTLIKWLPPGHQKKSIYNYLYRLANVASKKGIASYLTSTSDIFEGFEHALLQKGEADFAFANAWVNQVAHERISGLKMLMWLDFDITLFSDLLVKMDIATMAHSLEGRSPMLSKELLEWAPSLPDNFKINGKTTKYLLRKLAGKYLPETLLHQPKRGFEVPLKEWVNGPLKTLVHDHLHNQDALFTAMVKPEFVNKLLENKGNVSAEKRAKMLWTLTSLEIWYKHQKSLYRPA